MKLRQRRLESLDTVRVRILRETEAALWFGLTHPDSITRIPTVEVGRATFSTEFAQDFWTNTLGLADESVSDA